MFISITKGTTVRGYPEGLRGKGIAIEARIMGIADFFDALTSERSYKDAVPKDQVIAMLLDEKDGLFDAELVDIFVKLIREKESCLIDLANKLKGCWYEIINCR